MDEDAISHSLVATLRMRGVDVETALDSGLTGGSDEEQLRYATAQGRVLYSFNIKDFYQLHTIFLTQGQSHAGIVLAGQRDFSVGEQMRRLLNLIARKSAEEMKDRVEFLSAWGQS